MSGLRPANNDKHPAEGVPAAPSGFLLVDKPEGPTSFDVVAALRRITGQRRIGHAGTLDPLASGLLIVGVGREATRRLDHFAGMPKVYEAVIHLGAVSETDDRQGPITPASPKQPTVIEVSAAVEQFLGAQEQVPPQFSAIKVNGKKAYDVARKGGSTELKPRTIEIYTVSVTEYDYPLVTLTIHCSSGTYVRSVARDLGVALGTGGYLQALRRTGIGEYVITAASPLDSFGAGTSWVKLLFNKNID